MINLTLSLVVFLLPLAYSPGPGNMFFAANGARFGFSYTLAANVGYHVATLVVTLLIGIGYQWVLAVSPEVFLVLKILGVAYILYLAWKLTNANTLAEDINEPPKFWSGFWGRFGEGMILLLLNPKAYLIIVLVFSQFLPADRQNDFRLLFVIAVIFTLNNMIAFGVWAYAGDRLAVKFRNKESSNRLNRIFGIILVMVAIWMLIT